MLADVGWAGYFYLLGKNFITGFFLPNGDINLANRTISQLTNNYTDFNISGSALQSFASFNDFFLTFTLEPTNLTGSNVLFGSRLIPEIVVRTQPDQLANTFLQINDQNIGSVVAGHFVAGGKVSNMSHNNSVNIAWRKALLHMIYVQGWPDETSVEDQEKLGKHVTKQVEILQTVSGGSQSGAYMNEADPNERNWQQKFFGTMENYNRLKSIKDIVDPNVLFICKNCIGSDDWSEDLNCPKTSNVDRLHISMIFLLIIKILFLSI